MPYTTEKSSFYPYVGQYVRWSGAAYSATTQVGRSREQTGFRSGRLPEEVRNDLDGSRGNTWKDSLRVISGLEYEYNTRAHRQASVVNSRDYEENNSHLHIYNWGSTATNRTTDSFYSDRGRAGIAVESSIPNRGPLYPSEAVIAAEAARLMRSSVPAAPAVDLVRSLAELRDLPKSARLGNYIPQTGRDYASAYINQVFGLQPTGKDIAGLANAVLASTSVMERFLAHERQRLRRSRTTVLGELVFNREFTHSGTSTDSSAIRDDDLNVWGIVRSYAPPAGRDINGTRRTVYSTFVNVRAVAKVKSFATYEYFIPRPTGFAGRLDLYRRKAEQVLGGGLSPSALYALTPWTWMLDWFADVGGLIRYQQTVSENSVVATRSGYVYETVSQVFACTQPRWGEFDSISGSGLVEVTAKKQIRRPGGPYSILQPWSLSANQAAIVAALGVTRYSPF